ncbi:hypothetical protein [Polynucleobacter necessarius]|uniref:hypothetical protein n=1 Tax=Polynucleobacter necessarius TaxID=576610 RepID=UPI000E099A4F|nr:hypothetical protein [Polynucleobacter necessarius]
MNNDLLIVISYYSERSDSHLKKLLSSVSNINQNIVVVINSDECIDEVTGIFNGYKAITRPNTGMNIGAWDSVYRHYPNFKYYIFLQDECVMTNAEFMSAYVSKLEIQSVGMIGESINHKWDKPWLEMMKSPLNYPVNIFEHGKILSRVEYYLSLMSAWNANPGLNGRHLRALVWGFSGDVLRRIGGFPIGKTKEECIASEIAISKKTEQLGLKVVQIAEESFKYFRHDE